LLNDKSRKNSRIRTFMKVSTTPSSPEFISKTASV
jgi:hypothetical protein